MKKRIVIKEKALTEFLIENKDNHEICAFSPKLIMDKSEIETEPETYRQLKKCVVESIKKTNFTIENVPGSKYFSGGFLLKIINKNKKTIGAIYVYSSGNIFMPGFGFPLKLTMPQIWRIIKSLVGE